MRVLMLSWELPPTIVGGVGMVCAEICRELSNYDDIEIEYAMPYGPQHHVPFSSNCNVIGVQHQYVNAQKVKITRVPTILSCYQSPQEYEEKYKEISEINSKKFKSPKQIYGENILKEVELYASRVVAMFKDKKYDVIHAHDWTTAKAAIELKKVTGIPVVFHVHITEFDKTGNNGGHEKIIEYEQYGLDNSDAIVAVSNYTKNQLINKYRVDTEKIQVVYNAIIGDLIKSMNKTSHFNEKKTVLFMGRMTLQKGPEYFLRAAHKILQHRKDINFIIAGGGDQLKSIMQLSFNLGINENVIFHGGAYTRDEAERYYSCSDVFVMPSVSEPFGVVPYEAIVKGTPTVISRQSGISEVLDHALKVDFWDINEMANKIIGLIDYEPLYNSIQTCAYSEVDTHTWDRSVEQLVNIYKSFQK